MKIHYAVAAVLVLALAAAGGYAAMSGFIIQAPYDGSPPKANQGRIDAVTASATAWLAGSQGRDMFPVGSLAGPVAVFDENRTIDHWILTVKDDYGMYLGFFISRFDSFATPSTAMKYPDARHNMFSTSREEAYSEMLENHIYLSDQVREPYLSISPSKGYVWASDVVINGRKIVTLRVPISIVDPSDADNRLKTPA